MSRKPNIMGAMEALSAKSENSMTAKRDDVMSIKSDVAESIPHASASPKAPTVTLPKMTLYAHSDVLKAVRLLAASDGVQAQVILRDAMRDYLAKRGHYFSDLSTGK